MLQAVPRKSPIKAIRSLRGVVSLRDLDVESEGQTTREEEEWGQASIFRNWSH